MLAFHHRSVKWKRNITKEYYQTRLNWDRKSWRQGP